MRYRSFDLNAATLKLAKDNGITFSEARALLGKRGAAVRVRKNQRKNELRESEERRGLR